MPNLPSLLPSPIPATPVIIDVKIRGTIIILSNRTKMVPKAVIKAYVLLWERSVPEY